MLEIHSQSGGNSDEYHWTCSVNRSQKARTVFNPPFSLLHLTPGDNRRPALPLCPTHNPSSSAVSLRKTSRNRLHSLAEMKTACRGHRKVYFQPVFLKVCHVVKNGKENKKKEGGKAWLCYFSSLMRENERKAVAFCLPLLATT